MFDVLVLGIPGISKLNFWCTEKVTEPISEKFGIAKSFGSGIGKIWYCKKVSEQVSEKIGTEKVTETVSEKIGTVKVKEPVLEKNCTGKKSRNWYCKYLVQKKMVSNFFVPLLIIQK